MGVFFKLIFKRRYFTFPKLFVTDLDGTALGGEYFPYNRFPDPFSDFLDYLDDHGCAWAINSTWELSGQWELVNNSSVKSRPAFYMSEIGLGLATHSGKKPEPVSNYVDKMEIKLKKALNEDIYPLIREISSIFKPKLMRFNRFEFSFEAIQEEALALDSYMMLNYGKSSGLNINSNKGRLIVRPEFMSKGNALKTAIDMLGLSEDQVVVAGDEITDISMMQPKLAKFAICPDNSEEGVIEHVQRMAGGEVGSGYASKGVISAFKKLFVDP